MHFIVRAGSTPVLGTRRKLRPRGAAWSARHPVKVEAVGSNPIGDAFETRVESRCFCSRLLTLSPRLFGTVRQPGRATKFKTWWMWVRLPPVLLEQHASAGHWRAHVAVTHTPLAVQVQLLPGALGVKTVGRKR